jgi:peptidoglycan/xylan/chitin deacetylase (PgdA/CDA1 family)
MLKKLSADLSLDLDNKWSYMKTHGDPLWSSYPSYLDVVIPHFLQILREHDLKITVFIVGQDAAIESNQDALKLIPTDGHEIGNHSFKHEPWLQRYTREEIVAELAKTEETLASISDQKLIGFRGPGYSLSNDVLEVLCERGYQFDASTLPTYLGPLARMYYFFRSNLSAEQTEDRANLFGSFADGFRRLKPYRWKTAKGKITEIPVTTIPLVRAPFHFSYLLFLAKYNETLATMYFRFALAMCKLTRTSPSLLLHPLDFLGGDEIEELSFFPGMDLDGEYKRQFCSKMLGIYAKNFRVLPMGQRAAEINSAADRLPVKTYKA